jgi:hypothetical protein
VRNGNGAHPELQAPEPEASRDSLFGDPPSTMTAWTGVVAGPFADAEEMDRTLAVLQAELDAHGRAPAHYEIQTESGEEADPPEDTVRGGDNRSTVTAWIGVLVGCVTPDVILESRTPALGLAATLLFLLAGVGPGITCWFDTGDGLVQTALTSVLGIAVIALASVGMIWLSAWHPTWLLVLAVPSVLSCLLRLRHGRARLITLPLSRSQT